jgi:hypothetical protein
MAEFDGYSAELAANAAELMADAAEFEAHAAVRAHRAWPPGWPWLRQGAGYGAQGEWRLMATPAFAVLIDFPRFRQ